MLNVIVEKLGDVVILRCQGRIVRGQETAILCAAVQLYGREVILDLRKVDAIDAAGIGVLVSLQAAGVYLKLMAPGEQVREILRLTKLDSIFEICGAEIDWRGVRAGSIKIDRSVGSGVRGRHERRRTMRDDGRTAREFDPTLQESRERAVERTRKLSN